MRANVLERARRRLVRTQAFQSTHRRLGLAPPFLQRPIFLVGTVRSGTTFFAQCLAEHPQVINAGFELSREWFELTGVGMATPGLSCAHCPPADATAVAGRIEEVRAGFARLHLTKGGSSGTRFFNKSPHLWNKLPLLGALFPDAIVLVTSRDLWSTVASTKRLWEKMADDWGVRHYLPEDPAWCWSCVPPAPEESLDPSRLFPGGSAAVLAEYWLRVYETIERAAGAFGSTPLVRHQDFVENPLGTLREVERTAGLRPADYASLGEVLRDRNQRWSSILDERERWEVETFVSANQDRIALLRFAEVSL